MRVVARDLSPADDIVPFHILRMRFLVVPLTLVAAAAPILSQQAPPQATHAIRNVTLVDVAAAHDSLALKPQTTVVWRGETIIAVGPARSTRIPPRTTVIDGRGRYLIPGLWDMHVHQTNLPADSATKAAYWSGLPLAYGVTTVRDMSGDLAELVAWRNAINSGTRPGPRMFVTGQKLGVSPVVPGAPSTLRTERDIEQSIAMLAEGGADFVKVQELQPKDFAVVARASKAYGLAWVGHVGYATTVRDVARFGQGSIEHLTGILFGASDSTAALLEERRLRDKPTFMERVVRKLGVVAKPIDTESRAAQTMSDASLRDLASVFVTHNTAMVPTLRLTAVRLRMQFRALQVTTPNLLGRDLELTADGFVNTQGPAELGALFNAYCHATRILHEEGVVVLAGTDVPTLFGVPGVALHEELRMLNQCGLSPLAALRAATLEPARFMKREAQLGTIAVGKLADMVLLTADPIASIENSRAIDAVVVRGRPMSRASLDRIITRGEAAAANLRARGRQPAQ